MVMQIENSIEARLKKRKIEIEKQIEVLFKQQQELSRKSTSVQFEIIEFKGELKGLIKMINSLKEE